MNKKNTILLFFMLLIFSSGVFCKNFGENLTSSSVDTVLKVIGDSNYPPYEFLENGKPTGYNIELIEAIAEIMNLKIKIILGPWPEMRNDLETGKADIAAGMAFSGERDKYLDFSVPHSVVTYDIFSRKNGFVYKKVEDLKDKQVIVPKDTIMNDYLNEQHFDCKIITISDASEMLKLLDSGKYDCALMSKLSGIYLINKYGLKNIRPAGIDLLPREYCFAVHEGDIDQIAILNEGLGILKSTGQYNNINQKWFGVYKKIVFRKEFKYLILSFILAFILLLVTILWNWSLNNQVRKKNCPTYKKRGEVFTNIYDITKYNGYFNS